MISRKFLETSNQALGHPEHQFHTEVLSFILLALCFKVIQNKQVISFWLVLSNVEFLVSFTTSWVVARPYRRLPYKVSSQYFQYFDLLCMAMTKSTHLECQQETLLLVNGILWSSGFDLIRDLKITTKTIVVTQMRFSFTIGDFESPTNVIKKKKDFSIFIWRISEDVNGPRWV